MNKFEGTRKNTALTLALLEDWAKNEANENKNQLSMVMEAINTLKECKDLFIEIRIKDNIIREQKSGFLGSIVESEVGKMAVREFENS
jgi:hypothetical protein